MRTILAPFVLFGLVGLSACGGGPTTPTQPPPSSSALAINPNSATMSVGQSVVFTASGGDGYNYSFSAGPSGVLAWDQTNFNTVRVTLVNKAGLTSGWVNVIGYANGVVEKTVTVTFR